MPAALGWAIRKLEAIDAKLSAQQLTITPEWFDLDGFREYHPDRPARGTVYTWVSQRTVPFHKDGKKLRFNRHEIDEWLQSGRRATNAEIEASV